MIEWIVGGILLLGAVGKKLAESDNSGASHIGNGLEKLSDGTKNKICEMGEARGRASGMSDSELLKKARLELDGHLAEYPYSCPAPPLQQNTNHVILTTDRKENSYANVRNLLPFVRKLHQSQTAADEQHECFIMRQLPYQV